MEWQTTGNNKFRVIHDSCMEGGGTWFGQEYISIVKQRYVDRQFKKIFEWCAGPGFIGFNLLDHGLGKSICLSDMFNPAISAIQQTVSGLPEQYKKQVTAYAVDRIVNLPFSEQFDLVVANPPHFLECPGDLNIQRIKVDTNWTAHREFFEHIGQHLACDGIILLQENQAGSLNREKDFEKMIVDNGLIITDVFNSPEFYTPNDHTQIYYIEIAHA
jgi:methylase of polypeptide subunit release factors